MKQITQIFLFLLLFASFQMQGQQILKGKESNFYTSGELAVSAGQTSIIDFVETDEYVNAATVWNCTGDFLTIKIITALQVEGYHTCPPSSSINLTLSSDRFDTFEILSSGAGSITVNGLRDNRMVKESQGVLSQISSANCPTGEVLTPPVSALQVGETRKEVGAGTYTIAANSYYSYVRNAGFVPITVNGETVSPNGVWTCEHQYDEINKVQDFCNEINFTVPVGGFAWYRVGFPSD